MSEKELAELIQFTIQEAFSSITTIIIAIIVGLAIKSTAMNLWTRIRMQGSSMHGARPGDMIQEPPYSGNYYIVEDISWFSGKVTLGNPDDESEIIYRDIQSYWKHTIHARRPTNVKKLAVKHRRK